MGAAAPPSSLVAKIFEKRKHPTQKDMGRPNYFEIIYLALLFWFWNNVLNLECDYIYAQSTKFNRKFYLSSSVLYLSPNEEGLHSGLGGWTPLCISKINMLIVPSLKLNLARCLVTKSIT